MDNTTDIPEETVAALADPALLGNLKISTEDGIAETKEDGSRIYNKYAQPRSWKQLEPCSVFRIH